MAWALEIKVGSQFLVKPDVQIVDCLTPRFRLSFYDLSHRIYMFFLYPLEECMKVPSFQGGISTLLKLLKLIVKIRLHLKHMIQESDFFSRPPFTLVYDVRDCFSACSTTLGCINLALRQTQEREVAIGTMKVPLWTSCRITIKPTISLGGGMDFIRTMALMPTIWAPKRGILLAVLAMKHVSFLGWSPTHPHEQKNKAYAINDQTSFLGRGSNGRCFVR